MPELPEVETIAAGLRENCLGLKISNVKVTGKSVFRGKSVDFKSDVENRWILDISRHGKFLLIQLSAQNKKIVLGPILMIHLGMTGQLHWIKKNAPHQPHTHYIFNLNHSERELRYVDIRRFGWMEIVQDLHEKIKAPDAWLAGNKVLYSAIKKKSGMIKHVLLNQHVIAGLGNIYVDEILFMSKIHPRQTIGNLTDKKIQFVCRSINTVLKKSIKLGGTSFRNYVNVLGSKGNFKRKLFVYGQEGSPCRCGAIIKRELVAGRSSHFCPRCQGEK